MRNFISLFISIILVLGVGTIADAKTEDAMILQMSENTTDVSFINNKEVGYKTMMKDVEEYKQKKAEEEEEKRIQKTFDENCYFNPDNVTEPSNISVQRAYELLGGTSYQTWEIAQHYVDAEKSYPCVNAIINISIARHEGGNGYSKRAINQNNITGYTYSPDKYKNFNRKYDCIVATTNLLKQSYLNPEGDWFNGYDLSGIGFHYYGKQDGEDWSGKVTKMCNWIVNQY